MRMMVGAAALLLLAGCGESQPQSQVNASASPEQVKADVLALFGKGGAIIKPCDDAVELFKAALPTSNPGLLMDAGGATNLACSEAADQFSELNVPDTLEEAQKTKLNVLLDEFSNSLAARATVGRGVQNVHGNLDQIDDETRNSLSSLKAGDAALWSDVNEFGTTFGLSREQLNSAFGKEKLPRN